MRGRRTLFALLGALFALFVAFPSATTSAHDTARHVITTQVVGHKHQPSRRAVPMALAIVTGAAAIAALAVQHLADATTPTARRLERRVVASRGPPS